MELKQDICPHCGGTETVTGKQHREGGICPANSLFGFRNVPLYHVICRNCGTVIRSYVENPGTLD